MALRLLSLLPLVDCRIGSLERLLASGMAPEEVDCRIGSLENVIGI